MEKEIWKDNVMNSLHGIKRAEPNPFLFTRIEERMKEPALCLPDGLVPVPKLSFVFAGIVLLFAVNFLALKNSDNENSLKTNLSTQAYSLNNIHYQLY